MRVVYYAFAMACMFFSDLYWLLYTLIRPEQRMPFAANEIAEWAMFLMFAASLHATVPRRSVSAGWQMIGAVFFAGSCTALWIGWSGEWVQDILTGIVFGYFLCHLVYVLKIENVLATWEWCASFVVCLAIVVIQALTFFVDDGTAEILDLTAYISLFFVFAACIVRLILMLKKCFGTEQMTTLPGCVAMSFTILAWCVTTMYMSSGIWYDIALNLISLTTPVVFYLIRRKAMSVTHDTSEERQVSS